MDKAVYYLAMLVFALFLLNETHFYFNKKELVALVKKRERLKKGSYEKVVLQFYQNGKSITKKKKIKGSIYEAIKNKSGVIIFYDDFLFNDLYFKAQHPYFLIRLLLMYAFFTVLVFPSQILKLMLYIKRLKSI